MSVVRRVMHQLCHLSISRVGAGESGGARGLHFPTTTVHFQSYVIQKIKICRKTISTYKKGLRDDDYPLVFLGFFKLWFERIFTATSQRCIVLSVSIFIYFSQSPYSCRQQGTLLILLLSLSTDQ